MAATSFSYDTEIVLTSEILEIINPSGFPPREDSSAYQQHVRDIGNELLASMNQINFTQSRKKLEQYLEKFMGIPFSRMEYITEKEEWHKWWFQIVDERGGDLIRYSGTDDEGNEITVDWQQAYHDHPPADSVPTSASSIPSLPVQPVARPPGPEISHAFGGNRRTSTSDRIPTEDELDDDEGEPALPEDDAIREERYFNRFQSSARGVGSAKEWNKPSFSSLNVYRPPPYKDLNNLEDISSAVLERAVSYSRHVGRLPKKEEDETEEDKRFRRLLFDVHNEIWTQTDHTLPAARALYNLPYDPRGILKLLGTTFDRRKLLDSPAIYAKAFILPFESWRQVANSSSNRLTKAYTETALAAILEDWSTTPFPIHSSDKAPAAPPSFADLKSSKSLAAEDTSPLVASFHGGYTARAPRRRGEEDATFAYLANKHSRSLHLELGRTAILTRFGDSDRSRVYRTVTKFAQTEEEALQVDRSCLVMIPLAPLRLSGSPSDLRYSDRDVIEPVEAAEMYAASLGANSFSSNIAPPGPSGLTTLVSIENLVTDQKQLARIKRLPFELEQHRTPIQIVGLHSSPACRSTAGDIFLVPKSRFLNGLVRQMFGNSFPLVWDRRKLEEEDVKKGLTFISSDLHDQPKRRGVKYEHPQETCEEYLSKTVFQQDLETVNVLQFVLFSLPAIDFFAEIARKQNGTEKSEFSRFVRTSGAVLTFGNNVCIIVAALPWLNAYNYKIEGSPHAHHFATSVIASMVLAWDVGVKVSEKINSGMLKEEILSICRQILQDQHAETNGFAKLLRFSYSAFSVLARPLVQPQSSIEAVKSGLVKEQLRIAEGDDASFIRLLAIGYNGDTSLVDHIHRYQNDVRAPAIAVFTSLGEALNVRVNWGRIESEIYLVLFKASEDEITTVRVIALGGHRGAIPSVHHRFGLQAYLTLGPDLLAEVDSIGNLQCYFNVKTSTRSLYLASVIHPDRTTQGHLRVGVEAQQALVPQSARRSENVMLTHHRTLSLDLLVAEILDGLTDSVVADHVLVAGAVAMAVRSWSSVRPGRPLPKNLGDRWVKATAVRILNELNVGDLPYFTMGKLQNWFGNYSNTIQLKSTVQTLLARSTPADEARRAAATELDDLVAQILAVNQEVYAASRLSRRIETLVSDQLLLAIGRYTLFKSRTSIVSDLDAVTQELAGLDGLGGGEPVKLERECEIAIGEEGRVEGE
ncbi:uncharacterized protein JCM6883_006708 [Sporobolomyces salmoneus]|uniref:uncharacterized protein n=1 Tax=Sporobolomyces salmoneus TaxID=183962 RepID=UPI003182B448